MGEPVELGKRLSKLHRPRLDLKILLLVFVLMGLGLALVYSLAGSTVYEEGFFFKRQCLYIAVGAVVFVAMYFVDYQKLIKYSYLWSGAAFLLGILIFLFGREINGMRQYFSFFGFSIKGPNLMIAAFLVSYVGFLNILRNKKYGKYVCLLIAISMFLMLLVSDVNNAFILAISLFVMTAVAVNRQFLGNKRKEGIRWLIGTLALFLCFFVGRIIFESYRMDRIQVWLSPEGNPKALYQLGMIQVIRDANWIGTSFQGSVIESWFPGTVHDVTFAYLIGKYGILTACSVVVILIAFIVRMYRSAHVFKEECGSILMYGIGTYFCLQYLLNIGTNLNLIPAVCCPMPFISYNGGGYLVWMGMLGLFLGIYRRKDILPERLVQQ